MASYQKKWFHLLALLDYGGIKLCKDVLHTKEGLPYDRKQLCQRLKVYEKDMDNCQKKILCPPDGETNESEFDILLCTKLIEAISSDKYGVLANDLRKARNALCHVPIKDMSTLDFEKEWENICDMLQGHGFVENVHDLKNDILMANTRFKKTLDFNKSQIQATQCIKTKTTESRKECENWLRLTLLINFAGKSMCYDILHKKEQLPDDGAQLYSILESHKNNMHYQLREEILCPQDKIIDESKFDLQVYATVIRLLFKDKYKNVLSDIRRMRNEIFHDADISTSTVEFERQWSDVFDIFHKHDFDMERFTDLKTCDLFSVEECKGLEKQILDDLEEITQHVLPNRKDIEKESLEEIKAELEKIHMHLDGTDKEILGKIKDGDEKTAPRVADEFEKFRSKTAVESKKKRAREDGSLGKTFENAGVESKKRRVQARKTTRKMRIKNDSRWI